MDYAQDFVDVFAKVMRKYSMEVLWPDIMRCVVEKRSGARGEQLVLPWRIPDWTFQQSPNIDGEIELPLGAYPYVGELQARIEGRYLTLNGWLYDDFVERKIRMHSSTPSTLCNNCSTCEWYSDLDYRLKKH